MRSLLRDAPERVVAKVEHGDPPPADGVLAAAILGGLILPHYQPKVSLRDRRVVGVEALARWPDCANGDGMSPEIFVPLAERSGQIVPLTLHIMRTALEACARWRVRHQDCCVAVNISPLVLADPTLPDVIEQMLTETGLGPGALIAEITESTVIANPTVAAEVLTRLRIKGIELSIDDFGTGHSSLLTLLRLPFSELKIDRSFISMCETDAEAWKIVRATISMARELGLRVVAEGIETERSPPCCAMPAATLVRAGTSAARCRRPIWLPGCPRLRMVPASETTSISGHPLTGQTLLLLCTLAVIWGGIWVSICARNTRVRWTTPKIAPPISPRRLRRR